jgi:hypothetical protein
MGFYTLTLGIILFLNLVVLAAFIFVINRYKIKSISNFIEWRKLIYDKIDTNKEVIKEQKELIDLQNKHQAEMFEMFEIAFKNKDK